MILNIDHTTISLSTGYGTIPELRPKSTDIQSQPGDPPEPVQESHVVPGLGFSPRTSTD